MGTVFSRYPMNFINGWRLLASCAELRARPLNAFNPDRPFYYFLTRDYDVIVSNLRLDKGTAWRVLFQIAQRANGYAAIGSHRWTPKPVLLTKPSHCPCEINGLTWPWWHSLSKQWVLIIPTSERLLKSMRCHLRGSVCSALGFDFVPWPFRGTEHFIDITQGWNKTLLACVLLYFSNLPWLCSEKVLSLKTQVSSHLDYMPTQDWPPSVFSLYIQCHGIPARNVPGSTWQVNLKERGFSTLTLFSEKWTWPLLNIHWMN